MDQKNDGRRGFSAPAWHAIGASETGLSLGGPTRGRCPLLSSACVRFTRRPDSARTAVPGRAIPHWSNAL